MTGSYDSDKIYNGEKYADAKQRLYKNFEQIEIDNIDFFKSRPNKFDKNDHDRFKFYWNICKLPNSNGETFTLTDDLSLPHNIKNSFFDYVKTFELEIQTP